MYFKFQMLIWFKIDHFKEIPFLHFILADLFKVTFIHIGDKKKSKQTLLTLSLVIKFEQLMKKNSFKSKNWQKFLSRQEYFSLQWSKCS